MESSEAFITIIVPAYNAGKYIQKCLESVLAQGQWLHELIVVDGGSTDESMDILQYFCHLSEKIIVVSSKDSGQSDAMNTGLQLASGKVIGFVNADDWLSDGALEIVDRSFAHDQSLDILVGGLTLFQNGHYIYMKPSVKMRDLLDYKTFKWPLNPVGYFCSRSLYEKICPFPISNHTCMDYWFLLRAFNCSRKSIVVEKILGTYAIHGSNKTQTAVDVWGDLHRTREEFLREMSFGRHTLTMTTVRTVDKLRTLLGKSTIPQWIQEQRFIDREQH